MTIFVSVAAYRDAELAATLADCRTRARWPGDLRFGVCRQHAPGEPPPERFAGLRLLDVPADRSGGACWARARAMTLYDGEDFYLQIDSHHRFADGWDAILLDQFALTGSAKPLLSTYAAGYDPTGARDPAAPTVMRLDGFSPAGIPLFRSRTVAPGTAGARPQRARFVSAHLLFASGRFVADVPYDEELYFIGEEISLAVRAFTHGYDLFHPGAHVAWHHYGRAASPKHWTDRPDWPARDKASLARGALLLRGEVSGRCGLGTARTLAAYQSYAGVDFARRRASPAARRGDEPAPLGAAGRTWQVRMELPRGGLDPAALGGRFWYVGVHDATGRELLRADADRAEIAAMAAGAGAVVAIERQVTAVLPPAAWTIWPTDRAGRWLAPIRGTPATEAAA